MALGIMKTMRMTTTGGGLEMDEMSEKFKNLWPDNPGSTITYLWRMNLARELKNDLINRIEAIDDVDFLQAIQAILDSSSQELYELDTQQLEALNLSRQQLQKGDGVSHHEVIKELAAWLKNK